MLAGIALAPDLRCNEEVDGSRVTGFALGCTR